MLEQLKDIWGKRELLYYMVKFQMKAENKDKVFGFMWSFLDPLLLLLTYTILVYYIFGRGGPQFPILLFIALLSWRWFASSLIRAVVSINSRAGLVKSVRFPLAILPLSGIVIGFFEWLFGFIILLPMLFIFKASLSVNILWLPILLAVQFVGTIGVCFIVAIWGTYLSDLRNVVEFAIRICFYLSPILYSAVERVPERLATIYMLGNPFAGLLESYKSVVVYGVLPSGYAMVGGVAACGIFLVGLWYFSRNEYRLVKAI